MKTLLLFLVTLGSVPAVDSYRAEVCGNVMVYSEAEVERTLHTIKRRGCFNAQAVQVTPESWLIYGTKILHASCRVESPC